MDGIWDGFSFSDQNSPQGILKLDAFDLEMIFPNNSPAYLNKCTW